MAQALMYTYTQQGFSGFFFPTGIVRRMDIEQDARLRGMYNWSGRMSHL